MKMIEWNINQRHKQVNYDSIPGYIAEALWEEDPDFFVLTECFQVKHWDRFLASLGHYHLFQTENSPQHQNDILIGVKESYSGGRIITNVPSGYGNLNPNFLHIAVEVEGRELNIMGARIRVPKLTPASVESQTYRLNQLDMLLDEIEQVEEPIILVGDFNNYRRGLSPATLDLKRDPRYAKCALWNMAVIRERFHELGYDMYTPEGFSFGWKNPNVNYQVAQDHVFLKGLTLATNDFDGTDYCYYSDEFIKFAPDVYKKQGIKRVRSPHPDHKMLIVEFDMNDLI